MVEELLNGIDSGSGCFSVARQKSGSNVGQSNTAARHTEPTPSACTGFRFTS
jgi:hypothetical protein